MIRVLVVAAALAAAGVLLWMGGRPEERSNALVLDGAKTHEDPANLSSGIDAGAGSNRPNMTASTADANRIDGREMSMSTMTASRTADHSVAAKAESGSRSGRKEGDTTDAFAPASQAKTRVATTFPDDAEAKIWQALAANQHLNFTSIDRVECQPTICEIRYTGGPDLSDSRGVKKLSSPLSSVLPMIKSETLSSRVEISPGVYSSVVTMRSYIGSDSLKDEVHTKPVAPAN